MKTRISMLIALLFVFGCSTNNGEDPDPSATDNLTESHTLTLEVDHFKGTCIGEAAQLCLRVREEGEESFDFLYSSIEGFDFQWGRRYELAVTVFEDEDPPADGSSYVYVLDEVLSEETVEPGTSFPFLVFFASAGHTPFLSVNDTGGTLMDGREFRCEPDDCDRIGDILAEQEDFTLTMVYDDDIDAPLIVTDVAD